MVRRWLVLDNAAYHRGRKLQRFPGEDGEQPAPFRQRPCSPEVNLIEYARGYLKETATNNHFLGQAGQMERAAAPACHQLNSSPESAVKLHFRSVENFQ